MKIVKKINNNIALGIDDNGRDLVVCGNGVGFKEMPYMLTDLSQVQRTYYDVSESYIEMFKVIPEDILMVASDIVDLAKATLNCELNPNLPITLADHLSFASERIKNKQVLLSPLAFDVENMYPKEYSLGKRALILMKKKIAIDLPESEATSIALHLINAEDQKTDMHTTVLTAKIINQVTEIIEEELQISFKQNSFNYSRFVTHLRYLIQRQIRNQQYFSDNDELYAVVSTQYPKIFHCVEKINDYFISEHGWKYSDEEKVYLILHINRVCAEI